MEGMLLLFVLGIVLAIGIPSYLRWRINADEKATLADLRALQRAMAGYKAANGGFYDSRLVCLVKPGCIPNRAVPPGGFGDASLASSESRHGYRFSLMPGPPAATFPATSSPTSVISYCYAAAPEEPSNDSRVYQRSFVVDDTGRICVDSAGEPIECILGRLPRTCTTLE